MALAIALFVVGVFSWTFVEYLIHGWMSHVFKTFATPLHAVHHKDPTAVFTLGAWPPTAALWVGLFLWRGWSSGVIFYSGLVCGFAAYEFLHYRIHYARSGSALESRLRAHHLVHHERRPDACFGVTTTLWDRIFGSEPEASEMARLSASVSQTPLTAPSNLRRVLSYAFPLS